MHTILFHHLTPNNGYQMKHKYCLYHQRRNGSADNTHYITDNGNRFHPHNGQNIANKQWVLIHGHQGWNVRHGLCHIYMRYVYIYMSCLYPLFLLLFVHYCNLMVCVVYWVGKWQSRGSTGMFGNLMAIYHIMLQFIQNHSRFVMLMIWK